METKIYNIDSKDRNSTLNTNSHDFSFTHTSSGNNIIAFFESVHARIQGLITIKGVLADTGFYNEEFIQTIESKRLNPNNAVG